MFFPCFICCRAPEPQVLDYRTQQYKLIPAIAACFAMKFSANWIWDMYNVVNNELDQGDLERLPEVCSMIQEHFAYENIMYGFRKTAIVFNTF